MRVVLHHICILFYSGVGGNSMKLVCEHKMFKKHEYSRQRPTKKICDCAFSLRMYYLPEPFEGMLVKDEATYTFESGW